MLRRPNGITAEIFPIFRPMLQGCRILPLSFILAMQELDCLLWTQWQVGSLDRVRCTSLDLHLAHHFFVGRIQWCGLREPWIATISANNCLICLPIGPDWDVNGIMLQLRFYWTYTVLLEEFISGTSVDLGEISKNNTLDFSVSHTDKKGLILEVRWEGFTRCWLRDCLTRNKGMLEGVRVNKEGTHQAYQFYAENTTVILKGERINSDELRLLWVWCATGRMRRAFFWVRIHFLWSCWTCIGLGKCLEASQNCWV